MEVTGTSAPETLPGTSGDDTIFGDAGNDTLLGYGGNDSLDGGVGDDSMEGGYGDDLYYVDAEGDEVVEALNAGEDTVMTGLFSYTLGANVENLVLFDVGIGTGNELDNEMSSITEEDVELNGLAGNDTLTGGVGDDGLDGGTGDDTMNGGYGDDFYEVDSEGDVINELGGIDTVTSTFTYTLAGDLEHLHLASPALNGYGNTLDNQVFGNSYGNRLEGFDGNDTLSGDDGNDTLLGGNGDDSMTTGLGADSLDGGTGEDTLDAQGGTGLLLAGGADDDTYFVDSRADVLVEAAGEGLDTVFSAHSWRLGANFEILVISQGNGTGNALDNQITGLLGSDYHLSGLAGNDSLTGVFGHDVLLGGAGDDSLDGGNSADTLVGGKGDDEYVVDNADDLVLETAGEGSDDRVEAFISWTLGANFENLTLAGTASFGMGNELDNFIIGNDGDNVLSGGFGNAVDNDTLLGGDGEDVLDGGEGADSLDGGAGADVLIGGPGGDHYVVDDVDDITAEDAADGTGDRVHSSISWTLDDNVEQLELLGVAALNGTGNELNNLIFGNGGNNRLDGRAGVDDMRGGAGNDIYVVDNAADSTGEGPGEGTDTVRSSVTWTLTDADLENLVLTGAAAIDGTGNGAANKLTGNLAINVLDGGAGKDILTGGAGADAFVYSSALATANNDTIEDFAHGSDQIHLVLAVFTALGVGTLPGTAFKSAADITATGGATVDGNDRLLYNTETGNLYYDPDGSGAGARTLIFKLTGDPTLTASDIHVI